MTTEIGYGATLEVGEENAAFASPASFIANVTSATPPSPSSDIIDVTSMDSPNRAREFIKGLIDYGEAVFDLNWLPGSAADQLLRTLEVEQGYREYRLTFNLQGSPSVVTCTFRALSQSFQRNAPMDDKMTGTLSLKCTGAPVWA